MQSVDHIAELLLKYLRNELGVEEERQLKDWREASPENDKLFREISDPESLHSMVREYYRFKDKVWEKIVEQAPELGENKVKRIQIRTILLGAAAILVAVVAFYLIPRSPDRQKDLPEPGITKVIDIPPGSDKAILTLANGSTILLDSFSNQDVLAQGGSMLVSDKGRILYLPGSKTDDQSEIVYNTLTTPRAGQFELVLPDSSKVWLNAASSITYPTVFEGKERKVIISGEAYFEITKNPKMPFIVSIPVASDSSSGMSKEEASVEVLGTHFDVMAYPEEPAMKADLLEGSVRIRKGGGSLTIKPGQEAEFRSIEPGIHLVEGADVERAVDWKNGRISFTDADIRSIMRVLERWYDIEVVFEGQPMEKKLQGGIQRNTNLSDVLKVLEAYGIHSKLNGRRLTVFK
jgi:transmembrane sensor